eukprot:48508_1
MRVESPEVCTYLLLVIGYIKHKFTNNASILLRNNEITELIKLFLMPLHQNTNMNNHETPEAMDIVHETAQTESSKTYDTAERTVLIIDGYVRQQASKLNMSISSVISVIIQQFYHKMHGISFIWEINNNKSQLLSQILSPNMSSSFDSDIFSIQSKLSNINPSQSICGHCNASTAKINYFCTSCKDINHILLKYYLKLVPKSTHHNNNLSLQIILVSLPSIIRSLSLFYHIYCPELKLYWTRQVMNMRNKLTIVCKNHWQSSVSIDDAFAMRSINSLTFLCNFDIISVTLSNKTSVKYNPTYYFDANKYLSSDVKNYFNIKWFVNINIINRLQQSRLDNKCMISDIYYNMWSLSINCVDNNTLDVALLLLILPANVSGIAAHIKLFCIETGNEWSTVKKFSAGRQIYKPDTNIILTDNNLNTLSIIAYITIIEVFDIHGIEMSISSIQTEHDIISVNNNKRKKNKGKNSKQLSHIQQPFSTVQYKFNPVIRDEYFIRCYYQNICISVMNDLEDISIEELQEYTWISLPRILSNNMQ